MTVHRIDNQQLISATALMAIAKSNIMKRLSLNQMEVISGGDFCHDVANV